MPVDTKKRVLVVDDEPGILRVLSIQLRLHGFEVISATEGSEAIELVKMQNPDIVLLDIIMPHMSGLEVLSKVRTFSQVPIIAFSANSQMAENAMQMGANDHVSKPFIPSQLVEKIKLVLGTRANES